MKFLNLLFVFSFFIFSVSGQDFLPKGLTEAEKEIYQDYIKNFQYGDKSTQPPSSPPRTPGEFEQAGGLIITWASYHHELREIVRHASFRVPVYIVSSNPSDLQSFLNQGNVNMENISIVQYGYNSVWVRDFGPQSVYLDETDELAFIDWVYNRPRPQDNLIPYNMSNHLDIPIYQMTTNPNRLVHTGGNLMFDGHGSAFSSKLILTENSNLTESQIDDIMYDFTGTHRYIKMDELPYDNISHLDMHMKLLDEETLLVGEFPTGISDGPFIENNLSYLLNNYLTPYDREYQVVRIPMVPSPSGNYPPNAHYRTFTNSLMLNDLVLVPTYHDSALNNEALAIYQAALPGYQIMPVNMENVISASGAIHCISREIAAENPIFIAHASIRGEHDFQQDFVVEAVIRTANGVEEASVFYAIDDQEEFSQITMTLEGEHYHATFPALPCNAQVRYYISATDTNGKTVTKPLITPESAWTFHTDGEGVDFVADKLVADMDEEITFSFTGCLDADQQEEVLWHFGEGAHPQTATSLTDQTVTYDSPGHKTISLTVEGEQLIRENMILISETTTFELVLETEGQGTTIPAPGIYNYNENHLVTLVAQPAEGWLFEKWVISGQELEPQEMEIQINMTEDITATAIFKEIETGIPAWTQNFMFDVFPNPAQGQFHVVMSPSNGPVQIQVFNLQGQLVFQDSVVSEYWDQKFAVNLDDTGVFFVKVSWHNGSQTKRVIVQ